MSDNVYLYFAPPKILLVRVAVGAFESSICPISGILSSWNTVNRVGRDGTVLPSRSRNFSLEMAGRPLSVGANGGTAGRWQKIVDRWLYRPVPVSRQRLTRAIWRCATWILIIGRWPNLALGLPE